MKSNYCKQHNRQFKNGTGFSAHMRGHLHRGGVAPAEAPKAAPENVQARSHLDAALLSVTKQIDTATAQLEQLQVQRRHIVAAQDAIRG